MSVKDKRAVVVASGPKDSSGVLNVRYHGGTIGRHFDATVLGAGVIGAAPAGLTPSTSTTGGLLTASTYFYRVSSVVGFTESALATEVSQITTGATSTVTLNWTAVTGAQSYKVYGRATGVPLLIATVTTNTFVDTGTAAFPTGAAFVAGTLGLKLRVGSNQRVINNVKVATGMHDLDAYYAFF